MFLQPRGLSDSVWVYAAAGREGEEHVGSRWL